MLFAYLSGGVARERPPASPRSQARFHASISCSHTEAGWWLEAQREDNLEATAADITKLGNRLVASDAVCFAHAVCFVSRRHPSIQRGKAWITAISLVLLLVALVCLDPKLLLGRL